MVYGDKLKKYQPPRVEIVTPKKPEESPAKEAPKAEKVKKSEKK